MSCFALCTVVVDMLILTRVVSISNCASCCSGSCHYHWSRVCRSRFVAGMRRGTMKPPEDGSPARKRSRQDLDG